MIEASSSSSSRSVPGLAGWIGEWGQTDGQTRKIESFFPIDEEGKKERRIGSKKQIPFPRKGAGRQK